MEGSPQKLLRSLSTNKIKGGKLDKLGTKGQRNPVAFNVPEENSESAKREVPDFVPTKKILEAKDPNLPDNIVEFNYTKGTSNLQYFLQEFKLTPNSFFAFSTYR